jgi:hypothetical protein
MSAPRATDKAWEIDGASAAIKIARHAAQAAHRRLRVFTNIQKIISAATTASPAFVSALFPKVTLMTTVILSRILRL